MLENGSLTLNLFQAQVGRERVLFNRTTGLLTRAFENNISRGERLNPDLENAP